MMDWWYMSALRSCLAWACVCWAMSATGVPVLLPAGVAAESPSGEQIYKDQCASCHGDKGQGTKANYPHLLVGDRSLGELTRVIAKTMPADDPGTCTGADAEKVAQYVYDAFYSKAAQVRNQPARIDLARLTVRQYQNAVADLVGSFRWTGRWEEKSGLRGEYYKSPHFKRGDRVIERLDPGVRFDFGASSPDADKIKAEEFSIQWQGAVLAPETGEYEFNVRSPNGTRLWINDMQRPLVDAWVQSGSDQDHRATIRLLGGRAYPLRLEFFKSKQQKQAAITLRWTQPRRVEEVVPTRNLNPGPQPELYVLPVSFPPDDRSMGYERGTSISKAWDQAVTEGALETAAYVSGSLGRLLPNAGEASPQRDAKLKEACLKFVERAFRRPLSDEQKKLYVERQFADGRGGEAAVKRVVLLTLKSPRFLYREAGGANDAYDVAARLSFALWDSLPDEQLLKAAAANQLTTRPQVAQQAQRMVGDPRCRAKVREFLMQWLRLEDVPDLAKDAALFPGFDAAVAADLRTSLEIYLDEVVWGGDSDFRQLLASDFVYLNGRLAKFYGSKLPLDAGFEKVKLDAEGRVGVLTHPYVLAHFAYTANSSPIHRGIFLARSVLGRSLRAPPAAVAPLAADLHPDLTTRQRVALQTQPDVCQTCHGMINPLGFALESFDAAGRFRREEHGRPVDASGMYQPLEGAAVRFTGSRELAAYLAGSPEVHAAFVQQLFHHLVKQPIRAHGDAALSDLRQRFASDKFSIRKLLVEIAVTAALGPPRDRAAVAQAP